MEWKPASVTGVAPIGPLHSVGNTRWNGRGPHAQWTSTATALMPHTGGAHRQPIDEGWVTEGVLRQPAARTGIVVERSAPASWVHRKTPRRPFAAPP
ncbi:hypothetical protein Slala02_59350 [Streptomyces lavendulae subsp. lavendulae]|nr:hypothetical protein Slala01_62760 [Streptomyces lavendulae subsp. lavendulae]GLX30115.1 hypothetical protein Slala02_59350 [Streptomyces lavendulae subsp. lavendulae]